MKLKTQIQYWLALVFVVVLAVTSLEIAQFDTDIRNRLVDTTPIAKAAEKPLKEELSIEDHICIASEGEYCDLLVNLAKCESSLRKEAIGINTNGTYDAGLYQINSIHKDISLLDKLDVYASTRWTVDRIKKGDLHIWVCSSKI